MSPDDRLGGVDPGDQADPWLDFDEPAEEYPRHRLRRLVTRAVAMVLVIGLLLAFPLGYVLDEQIRNQHVEVVAAIVELVLVAVVVAALRSGRRPL